MRQIADDVWHVPLIARDGVNAYVLGDVLVDAGIPPMGKKLPGRLAAHRIAAHTLTHAHADHVGGSKNVLGALGVPFWVPAGDVAAVRAGKPVAPKSPLAKVQEAAGRFPAVERIDRELREGDEVGPGFVVLDTPGHSPGHVSFWRESDRVLICGDVWFGMNVLTTKPGLRAPLKIATVDPAQNRRSMQRLVDLRPDVVGFGHGPVLRDAASKLRVV